MKKTLPILFAVFLLNGCASTSIFDASSQVPEAPRKIAMEPDSYLQKTVVWGGVIAHAENLPAATRLEIVAYPLDDGQRPEAGDSTPGRFLVEVPGYLETADYAPGREITVTGKLERIVAGKVGEAPYQYPLITEARIHLWPIEKREGLFSRGLFSIGIQISN